MSVTGIDMVVSDKSGRGTAVFTVDPCSECVTARVVVDIGVVNAE